MAAGGFLGAGDEVTGDISAAQDGGTVRQGAVREMTPLKKPSIDLLLTAHTYDVQPLQTHIYCSGCRVSLSW